MLSRTTSILIATALITLTVLLTLFGIVLSFGHSTPHGVAPDLFDAMAIQEGDWVADVGSGQGVYTMKLAPKVGESGRVFAVDIDAEKLTELHDEVKDEGVENITTVYSVQDNPMLPARSFDSMLLRKTYHEFAAPERMLRHLKAALEPGGRLVMEESINPEMVGKSREEQTEEHTLGIEYAREELNAAGFDIETEMPSFVEAEDHRHWLLVATRPAGRSGEEAKSPSE